jgi:hypothetical protein
MLFPKLLTLHHRSDLTLRSILVCVMFMISLVGSRFLIIGVSLAIHLMIHLLTFLFKVLHIKHSCYLFTLFHFASSAHTRNLIVTPHRSLTENSLPHRIKNKRALGALRDFTWFLLFAGFDFFFLLDSLSSYVWRRWAGSALILVWCRSFTYRQIVTDLM